MTGGEDGSSGLAGEETCRTGVSGWVKTKQFRSYFSRRREICSHAYLGLDGGVACFKNILDQDRRNR